MGHYSHHICVRAGERSNLDGRTLASEILYLGLDDSNDHVAPVGNRVSIADSIDAKKIGRVATKWRQAFFNLRNCLSRWIDSLQ